VTTLDFRSPRYLVEHAKRRIAEFKAELRVFGDSKPYARAVEPNEDGTQDLYKVKLVKPIPAGLPGIALDAANASRSALDHAGYACAIATGQFAGVTRKLKTAFPFCDDCRELQGRRSGECSELPKEIFDLMASYKPCPGGNDLLWSLNKLANANKHRILVPVATVTSGFQFSELILGSIPTDVAGPMTFDKLLNLEWDSKKNEMVWLRQPHRSHFGSDIKFAFHIGFGDVGTLAKQPAESVFDRLVAKVSEILDAVEAEAIRIGL
jgi:hypothetical protein